MSPFETSGTCELPSSLASVLDSGISIGSAVNKKSDNFRWETLKSPKAQTWERTVSTATELTKSIILVICFLIVNL